MEKNKSTVDASPTKQFFMKMLTRDIELKDAILDLLDNCLDGVIRSKKNHPSQTDDKTYYRNFRADISVSETKFSISDNCGGIKRSIAENYAFCMGRKENSPDEDLNTVGIYGIGMKRAVFKMGKKAEICTRHKNDCYRVTVNPDWESRQDWTFPIENISPDSFRTDGTTITVEDLHPDIQYHWSDARRSGFINELIKTIEQHYMLILQKGFVVTVNGKQIAPKAMDILFEKGKNTLQPYFYKKTYKKEEVKADLMIGFYSRSPGERDEDDYAESVRTSDQAGFTVVCNDRVILYNDKTHRTGWGEAGVPQYHTQFIGIRGIVFFYSNKPQNLPMNTTKREIDLSSPVYADIKEKMREGLKLFTNYTNAWKGHIQEEKEVIRQVQSVSLAQITDASFQEKNQIKYVSKDGGQLHKPKLPNPKNENSQVLIQYRRPKADVDLLKSYLNGDASVSMSNADMGIRSFEFTLSAKKKENS